MKYFLYLVLALGFLFSQESIAQIPTDNDSMSTIQVQKIFSVTEFEPSFPGGGFERNKYFYNLIERNRKALDSEGSQLCYLKFVVDIEGVISEITSNNRVLSKLDHLVIEALKTGPKWIPARQNGFKVNSYASLTIVFESKNPGKKPYARNSIKYFLTKENQAEKRVQKLLVLVAGTKPARIFTDELYVHLKSDLLHHNVQTEYLFLGNEEKTAFDNFMNVSGSKTFDAILLFIQKDAAKIKEVYYETEISIRSISLQQSLNIFLIEPGDLQTAILEGIVFMNYRLTKKSVYSKASKDLLGILKENLIINSGT